MSATDELRRLLDERGVWHEDIVDATLWKGVDGTAYTAAEVYTRGNMKPSTKKLVIRHMATPEQAIAATLGREPDDAAMVRLHDQMNAVLLEYERAQGIEKRDGDETIVVSWVVKMHSLLEEAANLGRGECYDDSKSTSFFCCSECGCTHWRNVTFVDMPRYCPNCGRRVVSE